MINSSARKAEATLTPDAAYRQAWIIGLALGGGVAAFAVIAWVLNSVGAAPVGTLDRDLSGVLYNAWLGLSMVLGLGAFFFWRSRMRTVLERTGADADVDQSKGAANVLMVHIICWSFLEGAAVLGVLVFFLEGIQPVLFYSLGLYAVGFVLSRPKAYRFEVAAGLQEHQRWMN